MEKGLLLCWFVGSHVGLSVTYGTWKNGIDRIIIFNLKAKMNWRIEHCALAHSIHIPGKLNYSKL